VDTTKITSGTENEIMNFKLQPKIVELPITVMTGGVIVARPTPANKIKWFFRRVAGLFHKKHRYYVQGRL
jgi:hypothetical protein